VALDKAVAEKVSKMVIERVSGKRMVEKMVGRAVERVSQKIMAEKMVVESVERIHNKQIQVSSFNLLWTSLEVNSVV